MLRKPGCNVHMFILPCSCSYLQTLLISSEESYICLVEGLGLLIVSEKRIVMTLFFDVRGDDLGRLSSQRAVEIFHDLLYAEAALVEGIDPSKVCVPSTSAAVTSHDGGIDAEVLDAHPANGRNHIIKEGRTSYQIKTGHVEINNLSSAKRAISINGVLNPRVTSCLSDNGTLVIVLFGSDRPETKDEESVNLLRKAIGQVAPEFSNYEKIEVWRQSKLCGFLQEFPSIRLEINDAEPTDLHTIQSWANLKDMGYKIVIGSKRKSQIDEIQKTITSNILTPLRILGDPGIGKTRLVLEALKGSEFRSAVLYAETPSALPRGFLRSLSSKDNFEKCILVVDECALCKHHDIWNYISNVSERVSLVTIFNEEENYEQKIARIAIEPLESNEVAKIISSHNIPEDKAHELAELCSGSPRVAHMIGEQIELTGHINIACRKDLWERYIAGTDSIGSECYLKRLRVLKWLALFRCFGYIEPFAMEGKQVVSKISLSTHMSKDEVREIISDLRERKLLQGDYTLYITPKLFHLWLWKRWWDEQGPGFQWEDFIEIEDGKVLSKQLVNWFIEMLQYGRESDVVPHIVKELMGPKGPFRNEKFLGSLAGASLIRTLAEVAPNEALDYIEEFLAPKTTEELKAFRNGRRSVIDALRRTAIKSTLFDRSAKMILKLAIAENEAYSNNATGEFADLFSNGCGPIAASQASPTSRLPILHSVAISESQVEQMIAVQAISVSLHPRMTKFFSVRDSDLLHEDTYGWMPKTQDELWDAYRQAWNLAMECLMRYKGEVRNKLVKEMEKALFVLLPFTNNKLEVIEWIRDFINTGFADKKELIRDITQILKYQDDIPESTKNELRILKTEIVGTGFENEVQRYVGIRIVGEEYESDRSESIVVTKKIERLAEKSLKNQHAFESLLPWLVSKSPENGFRFGFELGRLDTSRDTWPKIIEAMRNAVGENLGTQFCSGYLHAIYSVDKSQWEDMLNEFAEDEHLAMQTPTIISDSGMSDRALEKIMKLFKERVITVDVLVALPYCPYLAHLSDDSFYHLIEMLLDEHTFVSARLALDLVHYQSEESRKISNKVKEHVIKQPELLAEGYPQSPSLSYSWYKVTINYLDSDSNNAINIIDSITSLVGKRNAIEVNDLDKVMHKLIDITPEMVWKSLARIITSSNGLLPVRLKSIYNLNSKSLISYFPPKIVLDWIAEDPDVRAAVILKYLPDRLYDDEGNTSLSREILAKYGASENVRRAMVISSESYSWSGSQYDALNKKIKCLENYRELDDNPNVLAWIEQMIEIFNEEMMQSHMREERGQW